ncbi:MAG: molybdenum cofactor guanylyltransferase MobA [Sulfuriferula sp.]|nr:molybdenum cofactor guanylyltransferase MobA [Sulfuriferula sp.]
MISGIILAGGESRRMGGQDKGLLPFAGTPLIQHVIQRIAPQVDELLISANRNLARYATYGYPVIEDDGNGFLGPLAGMLAGLKAAHGEWVLTVPCDTPFLPANLVERLQQAADDVDIVVASAGRIHATTMLCRRRLADNLANALADGERKVQNWQAGQRRAVVEFDDEAAFANLNTPQQLTGANFDERQSD